MKANNTQIEVVIPVYNEEEQLAKSIETLRAYLLDNLPYRFTITIVDNASTDTTLHIARQLEAKYADVRLLRLEQKGRGRALRAAWGTSKADIVSYMDVDLSTELQAFLPLIAPLITDKSQIAIGSRLVPGSHVTRSPRREIISRVYNLLIRALFFSRFRDAQCGFKAGRTEVVRQLLPLIENNNWFFDTEMLLLAERNGVHISEVPVRWLEDPDSRVKLATTIREDLKGLWRMRRAFWRGQGRIRARNRLDLTTAG